MMHDCILMIFFFFQMNLNPYILSFGKFKLTNLVNVLSVLIFHVSIHSVRGKWKFDDLTEKFVKSSKRDSFFKNGYFHHLLLWPIYWSAFIDLLKTIHQTEKLNFFLQFNRNLRFWIFKVAADKIIQSLAMQEEIEKKPFSRKFWILMRGKKLWFHVKLNWTTIKMFGLTSLTVQIIICQPHVLEKLH